MGISFVSGSMLNSDLTRSTDLAFNTQLLYLSVTGNRVGIDTPSPASTLEVNGNVTIGNILIPNIGNINVGSTYINNLADPIDNQDAATKAYVDSHTGNITAIANFSFIDTTMSTTIANANIIISPNGIGQLQVDATNGMVVPVGNTLQRPGQVGQGSVIQGTVRFNNELVQLEVYDGSNWVAATNEQSVITNQTITPDGSSAIYTLDQTSTSDAVLVTINGISQTPTIDYSVTGNTITFTTTPLTTDIVQVRFIAATTAISGVNLPQYTVAEAQALGSVTTGQMIYCINGDSGNPCLAVYSGGTFKRVSFGATIST